MKVSAKHGFAGNMQHQLNNVSVKTELSRHATEENKYVAARQESSGPRKKNRRRSRHARGFIAGRKCFLVGFEIRT